MAATYYVATTGNDVSGSGTSSSPWRTMAKAETTASRGDTVYVAEGTYVENKSGSGYLSLAKGITWRASGVVNLRPSSGIIALRVLSGSDKVEMYGFTVQQPSTLTTANYALFVDPCTGSRSFYNCNFVTSGAYTVRLQACNKVAFTACSFVGGSGTMIYSLDANLLAYDCTYTGNASHGLLGISSSSTKDVVVSGGNVGGSYIGDVIANAGSSNLTVSGLQINLAAGTPTRLVIASGAGETGDTRIMGNKITSSIPFSSSVFSVGLKTSWVEISGNNILLSNASPTPRVIDVSGQYRPRIIDNRIETISTNPITCISIQSSGVNVGSTLVRGNVCRTRSLSGRAIVIGTDASSAYDNLIDGAVIEYNRIYGPAYFGVVGFVTTHGILYGHSRYAQVTHNYVNGAGYGVIFKGTGQDWLYAGGASNNIFVNCTVTGGYAKGVRNTTWYNNTLYLDPTHSALALLEVGPNSTDAATYESDGTRLRQNIFYGKAGCSMVSVLSEGSQIGLDSDYNCVWNNVGSADFYVTGVRKSLASWQALGYDKHSLLVDPLFENPALNDFGLRSTSPCINPDSFAGLDEEDDLIHLPQFSYGALLPVSSGT